VGDYPGATECANRHFDGYTSPLRLAANISNAGGKAVAELAINRLNATIQHLSIPCIPKYHAETATRKEAFLRGFEHKTLTTEGTCNEDICSHFIRNYRRSNFYEQIRDSSFPNSQ
jgi:hypothetical protein